MFIVYLIMVFCASIGMSIQAAINNQLAMSVGGNALFAAAISFIVGAIFLTTLVVTTNAPSLLINGLNQQPVWRFFGGLFGAIGVFSMVYFMPKLGLSSVLSCMIAGQFAASLVIDHFGLIGSQVNHVSFIRIIGVVLLLLGANLVIFGDRLLLLLKATH